MYASMRQPIRLQSSYIVWNDLLREDQLYFHGRIFWPYRPGEVHPTESELRRATTGSMHELFYGLRDKLAIWNDTRRRIRGADLHQPRRLRSQLHCPYTSQL